MTPGEQRGRGPLEDLLGAFSFRRIDPEDHEANYRRPIPRSEYIRVALKFTLGIVAIVWFRFASSDGFDEGAEMTLAFASLLVALGVVDLVYLRDHEIELIFLKTKAQQIRARWALVLVGALLLGAGLASYGS